MMKSPRIDITKSVTNGVTKRSKTSGTTLRRAFSNLAPTTPIMKAGRTEPCKPTTGMKPKNFIAVTSPPDATAQAFGSEPDTSIIPRTIPTAGFPPNTRKVDQTTKPGKMMKAVSVRISV